MILSAKNAACCWQLAAKQVLTQNILIKVSGSVWHKEAYALVLVFVCAPQVGIRLQTGLRPCVAV